MLLNNKLIKVTMIIKKIRVQEALGRLLMDLEVLAPEHTGADQNEFYRDLYWQAQIYSFLDVDVWSGVLGEQVIREMILLKLEKLHKNIMYVYKIEQNKQKRVQLKSILDNIKGFNGTNGMLSNVIKQILYLNEIQS